jgi:rfaE bifunctional protein nucleotidyltransferase chain/domain
MITVFTNGCFDVFHAGHAHLLEYARSQGDRLVVGLNSDESVSKIKPGRPVFPFHFRRKVLAAIRWIDEIIGFDEETPEALIRTVCPNVLVKGEDWQGKEVAGEQFVLVRGGKIVFCPLIRNLSSTAALERIMRL